MFHSSKVAKRMWIACFAIEVFLFGNFDVLHACDANGRQSTRIFSGQIVLFNAKPPSAKIRRIELLNPTSLQRTPFAVIQDGIPIAGRVAPNGNFLAVSLLSMVDGKDTMRVVVIDAENHRRTIADDGEIVAWSPDSTRVIIRKGEKYAWTNSIVRLADGSIEKIPISNTDAVMDWSPDGSTLSVMAGRPDKIFEQRPNEFYPKRQLYLFNLENQSAKQPFTNPDDDCIKGMFSSDGSRLAYSRRTYDTERPVELCEITVVASRKNATIINFTELGVRPSGAPLWSQDGQQVLWQVNRAKDNDKRQELWFVPVDGSQHRIATEQDLGLDFIGVIDW